MGTGHGDGLTDRSFASHMTHAVDLIIIIRSLSWENPQAMRCGRLQPSGQALDSGKAQTAVSGQATTLPGPTNDVLRFHSPPRPNMDASPAAAEGFGLEATALTTTLAYYCDWCY
jgi:hypothetical protein